MTYLKGPCIYRNVVSDNSVGVDWNVPQTQTSDMTHIPRFESIFNTIFVIYTYLGQQNKLEE
jgi:hypothetical protein